MTKQYIDAREEIIGKLENQLYKQAKNMSDAIYLGNESKWSLERMKNISEAIRLLRGIKND